jgi:hypothetical protein
LYVIKEVHGYSNSIQEKSKNRKTTKILQAEQAAGIRRDM